MLIECPECAHSVSSEALMCPSCGHPIKAVTVIPERKTRARYRRLPNGFGSIKKLSGKRRNPYAAYPAIAEWTDEGIPVLPAAVGYYPTYQEAFSALSEYNKNPYDTSPKTATFSDVYALFIEDKKRAGKVSDNTIVRYEATFRALKSLHNQNFAALKKEDLQKALDALPLGYSSVSQCRTLLTSVYRYAMQIDIASKNWASFVTVTQKYDVEMGEPFLEDEIAILWDNTDDQTVRFILILIYSGLRITEAVSAAEIDLEENVFSGGLKTSAGRTRIVPIHPAIAPFVPEFKQIRSDDTTRGWRDRFYKVLKGLGIENTHDGKKHTPHDCRHTFSWLADKYEMDDMSKHLIMGHSLGGDVEKSVYGHRTVEELRAEMEKICY